MDFEQALLGGGTVVLKEGPDLHSLGVETSPSPSPRHRSTPSTMSQSSQITAREGQPSTPTVVPPTPSPSTLAPKISLTRSRSPSGTSTSSHDDYFDTDDGDVQTKRRSMFRSAGTASSPDLATLVRKAKERNAAQQTDMRDEEKGNNEPGATPNNLSSANQPRDSFQRNRPRSSTTVNRSGQPMAISTHKGKLTKSNRSGESSSAASTPISSDWVVPGPSNRLGTVANKGKSMRSKTSAFLGKIMGQSSLRSRTDIFSPTTPVTPSYSSSSFYESDAPPVPPIPRNHQTPIAASDIFSSPPNTPNLSKPLPPIQSSPQKLQVQELDSDDDKSIVVIDKASFLRSSSPDRTIKGKSPRATASQNSRRRSMSVSDADLKKVMAAAAGNERLPTIGQKDWDTGSALDGVMKDFKGELSSQLDSISNSPLDLKYPSTPLKGAKLGTDASPSNDTKTTQPARPQFKATMSSPTPSKVPPPSLSLDADIPVEDPIVPPRSSSLNTPLGKPNTVGTLGSMRTNPVKYGPRHPRPSGSNSLSASSTLGRDSSRLRVQHRSTASSSEPSLIPIRDDDKTRDPNRTVRLVPSSPSVGWPEATSPALSVCMSSQTDLTEENGISRVPSSSASREDSLDLESRGKDAATKCWREDDEFLAKEKIAEWLGSTGAVNRLALRYYINYFDFSGLRLDVAFRRLCAKLYLKAETQQVDRILEEFSRRYWETNQNTVYGSASVVHAVSYSLLLLNTDLHVAELAQRMSRSQFVRNTLSAIQIQMRPNTNSLARASTPDLTRDDGSSIRGLGSDGSDTGGSTLRSRGNRSGSVTSWNSISRDLINTPATTPNSGTSQMQLNGSNTSVHDSQAPQPCIKNASSTSVVYNRKFEDEMENLLKEMYSAIKQHQILQPLAHLSIMERASTSSLSPGPHHSLLRKRSLRGQNDRVANLKRGSMRGIQTLFNAQGNNPYGLDGRISPSPSFVTSTHESFGASSSQFLPPTLGFASNLSHTIIRETREDDERSIDSDDSATSSVSITDEELALLGAPWAKEGILSRKQYWESTGKRAKSKNWLDVFVVIQKGELNMFTFGGQGSGSGTMGVGGGNWLTNANSVGTVSLIHSLAHILPPPGYSRQRPHCLVLTLASGGVYFFQAGTEELVNEWVSTCNYWAARLSKEPLAGGVSNMEYGWNRVVDLAESRPSASGDPTPARDPDPSDSVSMRSGRSRVSKKDPFSLRSNGSPCSDRVFINEWKPPMPSTVASTHDEETQLEALQRHATALKADLDEHNALRVPMQQLYQPRSQNANKANANWERKSQYLLTEIVKYDSYVESLKAAMSLRLKKRGEKALEKALVVVSPEDGGSSAKRWKGYPEEETIPEGEEPPPTPGFAGQSSSQHRRESAGASSAQD